MKEGGIRGVFGYVRKVGKQGAVLGNEDYGGGRQRFNWW